MSFEDLQKLMAGAMEGAKVFLPEGEPSIDEEIEVDAGGGLVNVLFATTGSIKKIDIDPILLDKDNVSHLQQLLMAAINDGRSKWEDALKRKTIETLAKNQPEGVDMRKAMTEAINLLKR